MKTKGWAVIKDRTILVDTVSPTRRAAIVNYLVVYDKIGITIAHTDQYIEKIWEMKYPGRVYVNEVSIEIYTPE